MWDADGGELISAEISQVLNKWDYKAKVRYVTTDNNATDAS